MFAIPNATLKHCITEIEVEWKDFTFQVSMERFPILQDGIERIKQVLKHNCKYSHSLFTTNYMIKLNQSELNAFGSKSKQLCSSTHIIVRSMDKVTKMLYESDEQKSLQIFIR